jgi:2-C-methyl-D-erythritol 4-phosphate cytidylyltransferase
LNAPAASLPSLGVVLPAGGQGLRAGSPVPKQFLPLGSAGRPMFQFSLETFHRLDFVKEIVLVLPGEKLAGYSPLAAAFPKVKLAAGGAERWESVRNGIAGLSPSLEYVAVHDAARPFVSEAVIRRCLEAVDPRTCVIPALPATDTVKEVEFERVVKTLDRRRLILVQTPQMFSRALLDSLFAGPREGAVPTDEAMLAEQGGKPVRWVWGGELNRKVTSPGDLAWAQWIAGRLEKGESLPEG